MVIERYQPYPDPFSDIPDVGIKGYPTGPGRTGNCRWPDKYMITSHFFIINARVFLPEGKILLNICPQ
jgi:hypothetical protein